MEPFHDGLGITLFSAANYCNRVNFGAILKFKYRTTDVGDCVEDTTASKYNEAIAVTAGTAAPFEIIRYSEGIVDLLLSSSNT